MNQIDKQKLLLKSIFKACGGPTELQKLTNIPRQNFTNWQIRGRVPLLLATKISKEVGISKWGLNYSEFCAVDDNPIPWEDVVKSYFLPKKILAKLLEGEDKCEIEKATKQKKRKKKKKKDY